MPRLCFAPGCRASRLTSSSSCCEAEDVGPRTTAPIAAEPPTSLIDTEGLLWSDPFPSAPWDGVTDLLLGAPTAPASPAPSPAQAYRADCQRLAWGCGRLLTWAAAAAAVEQQQPQPKVPAAACEPIPIELDTRWDFVFCCMEAAARLGKRATYAMVAAAAC